jgi:hypothetical protein
VEKYFRARQATGACALRTGYPRLQICD